MLQILAAIVEQAEVLLFQMDQMYSAPGLQVVHQMH